MPVVNMQTHTEQKVLPLTLTMDCDQQKLLFFECCANFYKLKHSNNLFLCLNEKFTSMQLN